MRVEMEEEKSREGGCNCGLEFLNLSVFDGVLG